MAVGGWWLVKWEGLRMSNLVSEARDVPQHTKSVYRSKLRRALVRECLSLEMENTIYFK